MTSKDEIDCQRLFGILQKTVDHIAVSLFFAVFEGQIRKRLKKSINPFEVKLREPICEMEKMGFLTFSIRT